MSKEDQTDRIPLDAPYEPLNQFILSEQAQGHLAQLEPWDETKTARQAIIALRRYRTGHTAIRNYCRFHLEELPIEISQPDVFLASLENAIAFASYARCRSAISVSHITACLHAWGKLPDRVKPIRDSRSKNTLIKENAIHEPLNRVISDLGEHCLPPDIILTH